MMHSTMRVQTTRDGVLGRRTFLHSCAAGAAGLGMLGWKDALTVQAAELRKKGLSCILLWMNGGPSQFESFDPKPGHANGGPTKAISTSVPGIQIAEGWPQVAKVMGDIAVIRSMTGIENDHPGASYHLHTGYRRGGVKFPTFGSVVANEYVEKEMVAADFDLPHFVAVGRDEPAAKKVGGSGFLSLTAAPFVVANPAQLPKNVAPGTDPKRFLRQLELIQDLQQDYAAAGHQQIVEDHKALYETVKKMVMSPRLKAFDLSQEKQEVRDRYGNTPFGQACVLARRLVEVGVTFVEVESYHPQLSSAWDTHKDNFNGQKKLIDWVDPAFAALLADLKERGRLDKTLVIWMGEFGRSGDIDKDSGRNHQAKAFSVALAGAGIKGGQVIGATTPDGTNVAHRPVPVADLFCTFCHILGLKSDGYHAVKPQGRPIHLVDGGEPVKELLG